jgi:hypothetical protein
MAAKAFFSYGALSQKTVSEALKLNQSEAPRTVLKPKHQTSGSVLILSLIIQVAHFCIGNELRTRRCPPVDERDPNERERPIRDPDEDERER